MLDGYEPDGVFALGTGEKLEGRVSTPIVTRADDQGVSQNPLRNV
jgi:hypothetical protein